MAPVITEVVESTSPVAAVPVVGLHLRPVTVLASFAEPLKSPVASKQ